MSGETRNLWLIRHGDRLDTADPSWLLTAKRRHDTPLSSLGHVQAREVAARLAQERINHLFASPFLRALETAEPISSALNLRVRVEHGLCESFYERWFPVHPDFTPPAELRERFPNVEHDYASKVVPDYPESSDATRDRLARTIAAITNDFAGNLALVSHGGAITSLCQALIGARGSSVHAACCCLIHLTCRDGAWTLERDGRDTSHLSKSEAQPKFS